MRFSLAIQSGECPLNGTLVPTKMKKYSAYWQIHGDHATDGSVEHAPGDMCDIYGCHTELEQRRIHVNPRTTWQFWSLNCTSPTHIPSHYRTPHE